MIGLVRQELLSGIRAPEQYEKLRLHLRSFPDEVIDTSDYEGAAQAGHRCRAKGVVVSIVDTLLWGGREQMAAWRSLQLILIFKLRKSASPSYPRAPKIVSFLLNPFLETELLRACSCCEPARKGGGTAGEQLEELAGS
jgi:hypothetical protein